MYIQILHWPPNILYIYFFLNLDSSDYMPILFVCESLVST